MTLILVGLAGGLGAAARYLVDAAVADGGRRLVTPLGTLVVNTTACLLLGLVTGWALRLADGDALAAVVGVGFLGGYSTFSTAGVEAAEMLRDGRGWAAVRHAVVMLALGLGAALLGLALAGA